MQAEAVQALLHAAHDAVVAVVEVRSRTRDVLEDDRIDLARIGRPQPAADLRRQDVGVARQLAGREPEAPLAQAEAVERCRVGR